MRTRWLKRQHTAVEAGERVLSVFFSLLHAAISKTSKNIVDINNAACTHARMHGDKPARVGVPGLVGLI